MEFKLEKGKTYKLVYYDDYLDGEYVGVWHKTSGFGHYYKLIFKTGKDNYVIVTPDTTVAGDGTICVRYEITEGGRSFEGLTKPPVRPEEKYEVRL